MISDGSQPLITVPTHITNTIDIAELEFKEKKIPLFIKRYINQTSYELWRQEDMISI
jgi:DNA-directed RNA polymerase subunit K/omega